MPDQTFDEWLSSEHMKTFIHLRMRVIDARPVDYMNQAGMIASEAVRRELRELEGWRPEFTPEKVKEEHNTRMKAGEFARTQRLASAGH